MRGAWLHALKHKKPSSGAGCSTDKEDLIEEIYCQLLGAEKPVLGANHPYTLQRMSNLAEAFYDQVKYKEAEELLR